MSARVLVINSGSSSLKYQVIDDVSGEALAVGLVERIGAAGGRITHTVDGVKHRSELDVPDHTAAMAAMTDAFESYGPSLAEAGVVAVGHRVVQGGARFGRSIVLDERAVEIIDDLSELAPLHNPGHVAGIRVAMEQFPDLPHVAVFDTAFHLNSPDHAHTYAIDREVAERYRVRKYGFHGTSHKYVAGEAALLLGRPMTELDLITLHLGNGASATAIHHGRSMDTSMGLTPLQGLVMGSRSGDVDAALVFHLSRTAGMGIDEIDELLNKRSGVLGLSGSQDMRDLVTAVEAGDPHAVEAMAIYCYRIKLYVGAYLAALGRADAIVFTAGVGENSPEVRSGSLAGLEGFGIAIDEEANAVRSKVARDISAPEATVRVLVIPTNEELAIARESIEVIAER